MGLVDQLLIRAGSKCELCSDTNNLSLYEVQPITKIDENSAVIVCQKCKDQIESATSLDAHHWHCLNASMWSEFLPVQVMSYRILSLLKEEPWARDLLEQLYLDEGTLEWAKAGLPEEDEPETGAPTLDSNGTQLAEGDSVTLIKDLDVKGGGFTAKRGTLVKNISLTNNPKHIEGKVNGIQIVLVAAFLKKA
ncbi:PhnA domain-containing protein [Peredibacter sp. HCB2-198]|uniref:PhnA domain-containing protein n=1 Tax=Peredibacter sp. HCB2-198 TaxID=3383025 RepID=UPI0038B63A6D